MKAKFIDGPYKGINLHVGSPSKTLTLEIEVHVPDRLNLEGVAPIRCHALYIKLDGDEYESQFVLHSLRPAG